jgi:Mg2+-importing ATPase
VDALNIISIVLHQYRTDKCPLGFFQEHRAEQTAELLKEKITTTSTVLWDGKRQEIKHFLLVPNDIITLSAGDVVPADSRVLSDRDFFINQSALTGESFPVEKTPAPLQQPGKVIKEWNNFLFRGTSIVSGTAVGIVVRTGAATEFGEIALILVVKPPETEFERGLRGFGLLIMRIVFFLVIFVFFISALFWHHDGYEFELW